MPVRRKLVARPAAAQPDPTSAFTWGSGDGCRPFRGLGYRNEAAARKAWDAHGRRAMWARRRGPTRIPPAARRYDGLTDHCHTATIQQAVREPFDGTDILAGAHADLVNIGAFRARDPKGADQIRAHLDALVAHLEVVMRLADEAHGQRAGVAWAAFWRATAPWMNGSAVATRAGDDR